MRFLDKAHEAMTIAMYYRAVVERHGADAHQVLAACTSRNSASRRTAERAA